MNTTTVYFLVLISMSLAPVTSAYAVLYKCVDAKGKVSYSEVPCPIETGTSETELPGGNLDSYGCRHIQQNYPPGSLANFAGAVAQSAIIKNSPGARIKPYHCHRGPLAGQSFASKEEMLKQLNEREATKGMDAKQDWSSVGEPVKPLLPNQKLPALLEGLDSQRGTTTTTPEINIKKRSPETPTPANTVGGRTPPPGCEYKPVMTDEELRRCK